MLKNSSKKISNTYTICICSVMVAMYVVLDMFQLPLSPQLVVSFSYIPISITGWLFGVPCAMLVGGISDILSFLIRPTGAFFPGFTVTAILTGALFGIFLHGTRGKKIWLYSIVSKTLVSVLLNIGLNTLWTSMLVGKAYIVLLYERTAKNIVMLPIEIIVMALIIMLLSRHKILNK